MAAWLVAIIIGILGTTPTPVAHQYAPGEYECVNVGGIELYEHMIHRGADERDIYPPNNLDQTGGDLWGTTEGQAIYADVCGVPE